MAWKSNNLATRRFNLNLNQQDAFVLGYFGVQFNFNDAAANGIIESVKTTADKDANRRLWSNANELAGAFSALCEAVSGVPGGTLNFVDITAMGGTKWGAAGSIDFGDQVTLRFRELSGMPISKAIGAWANLIRHTNSGVSMLAGVDGKGEDKYTKINWSSDLYYWILKPDGKTVEAGIKFTGIYPMSDLGSQINTDITSVDGQTFDVNFHVDDMYWDVNSTKKCQQLVDEFYEKGKSVYEKHIAGSSNDK